MAATAKEWPYHQLIVWGSSAAAPVTEDEHAAFRAALKGHSFVEVFPGAIILFHTYRGENNDVINALIAIAKERGAGRTDPLRVVASPPSSAGSGPYGGLFPGGLIEAVRKRLGASESES